jgi:hypothetical protein
MHISRVYSPRWVQKGPTLERFHDIKKKNIYQNYLGKVPRYQKEKYIYIRLLLRKILCIKIKQILSYFNNEL